jgi:hypothetical protein
MLNWSMVRYKVKADRAGENESYITAVFEQLKRETPPGISYASFKLADGVSFMHIAAYEEALGSNPLTQLAAFKTFTAAIQDRCVEPPAAVGMQEIGFYSALGK